MSANIHLAPGVDTTLLKTHFAVVTDEVGALIFPMNYYKFPLTVNLVCSIFLVSLYILFFHMLLFDLLGHVFWE